MNMKTLIAELCAKNIIIELTIDTAEEHQVDWVDGDSQYLLVDYANMLIITNAEDGDICEFTGINVGKDNRVDMITDEGGILNVEYEEDGLLFSDAAQLSVWNRIHLDCQ
jgi:hypothetical protein